jgi:CheY-like chemotaxis protein
LVEEQPWYLHVAKMLGPLGVQTFEATSGSQAIDLIERWPIHLAIVDTRLGANDGLGILRILKKLRDRAGDGNAAAAGEGHEKPRRVPVSGEPPQAVPVRVEPAAHRKDVLPTVILVSPVQDQATLQAALWFEAFSVMREPVDTDLLLDLMARALRRFHGDQWPAPRV